MFLFTFDTFWKRGICGDEELVWDTTIDICSAECVWVHKLRWSTNSNSFSSLLPWQYSQSFAVFQGSFTGMESSGKGLNLKALVSSLGKSMEVFCIFWCLLYRLKALNLLEIPFSAHRLCKVYHLSFFFFLIQLMTFKTGT